MTDNNLSSHGYSPVCVGCMVLVARAAAQWLLPCAVRGFCLNSQACSVSPSCVQLHFSSCSVWTCSARCALLLCHHSIHHAWLQSVAQKVVAIAKGGLERRGLGEESFLSKLEIIADTGLTQVGRVFF